MAFKTFSLDVCYIHTTKRFCTMLGWIGVDTFSFSSAVLLNLSLPSFLQINYNLSCITNEETSQFKIAPFTISQSLIGSDVIVKIPDRFKNLIRNIHSMNEFYLYYHVPVYHLTALRFTRFPCSCAVMQNLSLRISSDQNKS